jgi:two-component system, NtrC family, sensor kinase
MRQADAAEPVELEDQISILKTQLEHAQRMATIGELTSTTTHEFNNLLMTILNYAKLGLRHKDEPTRDKSLQRILDAANRATKITGSVLSMARSGNGQFESTLIRPIIEDTLLLLEREFRKYRIQLETKLNDVPAVHANASQIQRVLVNLLVNARQATAEGGQVRIGLLFDEATSENVLTIRDTGSGIAAEQLPRIFDPYYTTKSGPDATGKGGTGIGLSSCKEIIDRHQGRIRVESSLGKGTAFIIRLPALIANALAS